jgi:hypothetical protein
MFSVIVLSTIFILTLSFTSLKFIDRVHIYIFVTVLHDRLDQVEGERFPFLAQDYAIDHISASIISPIHSKKLM